MADSKRRRWRAQACTLTVVLLAACQGGGTRTAPVATAQATPAMAASPVAGLAAVDAIEVRLLETFPVQVHVVARGTLPDSCTAIDQIVQQRIGDVFEITMTTKRAAEAGCATALAYFEQLIVLDVLSLPAGNYTVSVNGVNDGFTLAADNAPAGPSIAIEVPASCTAEPGDRSAYFNLTDGYCLLYPSWFRVGDVYPPGSASFYGPPATPDPEPVMAAATVVVHGAANGRSLSQVVDEVVTQLPGLPLARTAATIGGEPAEIVEGLPGRTGSRQVFLIHRDTIYTLSIYPVDPAFAVVEADVTELWQAVSTTFTFLPEGFAAAFAKCSAVAEGTSPYFSVTPSGGYCFNYPSYFRVGDVHSGLVNLYGPPTGSGVEPVMAGLSITSLGPANGRTLAQVVDDALSPFPGLGVARAPGLLGGEPAEIVEGFPGRTLTRQLYLIHSGTVYNLAVYPADPAFPQAAADVEAVWQAVTASFVFVP